MNLSEIRQFVIAETGRVDLTEKMLGKISLLDVYIYHGARLLDRKANESNIDIEVSHTLALGDDVIAIRTINLSQVNSIYTQEPDGSVKKMKRVGVREGRQLLATGGLKAPEPEVITRVPASVLAGGGTGGNNPDRGEPGETGVVYEPERYNGLSPLYWWLRDQASGIINIFPPAPRLMNTFLFGMLQSKRLTLDTDTNYWSVWYSDLLVEATSWQIERANRNTEGMRDRMLAIEALLQDIDKATLIAEEHELEGAMDLPVRP